MKKIDLKHTAFHVLVGVYFLWLIVYGVLIVMSLFNFFVDKNANMNEVFVALILLNFFMGFVLYLVIRLFKNKKVLGKVILYSFACMFFIAGATLAILKSWL